MGRGTDAAPLPPPHQSAPPLFPVAGSSKQRLRDALLASPRLSPLLLSLQRLLDYTAGGEVDLATSLQDVESIGRDFWANGMTLK